MHPILFKIGWFEVHSYGFLLMVSFLAGIYLGVRRAKKRHIDPNHVIDMSMVVIVSGLVGARAMYVVFHISEFRGRWLDVVNPLQSNGTVGIAGLTVLGGISLSIVCTTLFLWHRKLPVKQMLNIMAPSVALGFAITRIGCFLHGCCFGVPVDSGWGVIFPHNCPAGSVFPNQAIHPAQIYASIGGAVNFVLLLLIEQVQFFKDKTFFLFLVFYGITRFTVDIFRYYEESMILLRINNESFSVNQGISLLLILMGIYFIFTYEDKPRAISKS